MASHTSRFGLAVLTTLALAACGEDDSPQDADTGAADVGMSDTGTEADAADDTTADAAADTAESAAIAGRCDYTNPFGGTLECKQYDGAGWTAETAAEDCAGVPTQTETAFVADARCALESELGRCAVDEGDPEMHTLVIGGDDAGSCNISKVACESFAGGTFTPSEICEDTSVVTPTPTGAAFTQEYLDCRPPLEGEPAGANDGDVCTRVLISGCTEPGRQFDEYGSCEDVRTQRPYFAFDLPATAEPDDPRLEDDEYMEELAWVADQIEACACVCCHASDIAPDGPAGWDIRAGDLWIDTVPDGGLAMLGGLVDSDAFGAYLPEENNGFSRTETGVPTTDVARMQAFLVTEYLNRGNELEDAEEYIPFGGPLYTQTIYEPEACDAGEGFDAEGAIQWPDGDARYLYVMAVGTDSPGVPPNRDLPEGTIWHVDVSEDDAPFATGVMYGEAPENSRQRVPFEAAAPALEAGAEYYVYALKDIAVPLLRCISTYPG